MDGKMSSNAPRARAEPRPISNEVSRSASRRRAVLAATIGNTLEWYDFLIYGFLAATIGKLFFPTEHELTSLLLSVATFGVGAVVRPVAGVVLGIYADRVGRRAALILTIFIMGWAPD
jgi:MFS transporter, MHS family, proline/betaine transporter